MRRTVEELIAGRYRLLARVGQGGQGRVWRARDEMLGREVAVKELVLPAGIDDEARDEMHARTLREARAIAQVANPHVVRVYDVVQHDEEPWIVMELVDATSLDDALHEGGPATPEEAAQIGLAVLSALRAAHLAGVLHRDVKPANVLLAEDGRVLLTDFGMAEISGDGSITETGIVLGSPAFMAPERALGQAVGPPADMWSLGATLYAAVEDRTVFDRTTSVSMLAAVATAEPDPPQHAGPMTPVLDGLLQRDPADRLTIDEAEAMMRAVVAGTATVAMEMPVRPRSRRSLGRKGVLALVTASLALLAVGSVPVLQGIVHTPGAGGAPNSVAADPVYQVVGQRSGLCLEPSGARQRVDRILQLGPCGPNRPGQRWTFRPDGTVRAQGLCLATKADATATGTAMIVTACRPGAAAQKFRFEDAGDLVSVRANACVDAVNNGTAAGTPLQIWTCAGTPNQKWRRSPIGYS